MFGCEKKVFKRALSLGLVVVILCATAVSVHAAAAAQRRVQQQKMQQQMMEQQYQQQYQQVMMQKQAQEYQKAMVQKQAYEQAMYQQAAYQKAAVQYAAQKQQMQQMIAQRQAEWQAAQQMKAAVAQKQAQQVAQYQQVAAYKQAVAQKQAVEVARYKQAVEVRQIEALKQKRAVNQQVNEYTTYLAKRKHLMEQQAVVAQQAQAAKAMIGRKAQENAVKTGVAVQAAQVRSQQANVEASRRLQAQRKLEKAMPSSLSDPSGEETEVDIRDLWAVLDKSSLAWSQIIDREVKVLTVAEYMDRFSKGGIKIKKLPGAYASLIDGLTSQSPELLEAPFMNVLSYAAIMEYDFENGENKDELARRILGEERFKANQQRLSGH